MSLEHEWKDANKCQIGVPAVHAGDYRSNPPNRKGREDTDRGRLRAMVVEPNTAQSLPRPTFRKPSQEWGLQAQRNPPDARKLRTKSPFATQRPDTQSPIVDRQWIPNVTAFGTQESNSPIENRPVVRLARSAFLNPSAEA